VALFVGTSGWQYDDWATAFYPEGMPKSRWLEHYASHFATVESNSAFYRLPKRELFESWADRTPADFVMSVKASRYLTHVRRLRDPLEPVAKLLDRMAGLGAKRGPVLLQLPPNLKWAPELLSAALSAFPQGVRVAVEVRHESWLVDDLRRLLQDHGAAFCLTDRLNRRSPLWRTSSWGYARFHEGSASPEPSYGRTALDSWAGRIASLWSADEDVFCYFNNDKNACAARDAHKFALAARRHGLAPGRADR
jgi:uncharacterized protein YecE (DUF72 family)